MSDTNHKTKRFKAPNRFLILGVLSLVIVGGLLTNQIIKAEGNILPNVSIGGIAIGNMSPEKARAQLEDALRALNLTGIEFIYEDKRISLKADTKNSATEDSIIIYDIDKMVDDAFLAGNAEGRTGFIMANLQALFSSIIITTNVDVNHDALIALLKEEFENLEHEPKDAEIEIFANADGTFEVSIEPETIGTSLDYEGAINKSLTNLARWEGASLALTMEKEIPEITQNKAELMEESLLEAAARGEIAFGFDDITWSISGRKFTKALTLKTSPDSSLYVGMHRASFDNLFDDASQTINQTPQDTHLVLNEEGNRATEFEGGRIGRTLNAEKSLESLEKNLFIKDSSIVPLVVNLTSDPDSDALAEELGIRELIGWGTSDFSGSPNNRRINIRNGVDRLWGWIIPPGEEFGLLDKLRPFTAEGGYTQELVIKGDRTVREYGGGLCQIGTTTFRAVMGAGLPITQRQNHSYSVSYYAPAGTDATLYDPAPDFKFKNDTKDNALIITKMIGDILRFEFWGTRDGRVQERSEIKYWDYKDPPEPKLIPTSALESGKQRCFEIGHKGLKASFDYTITYADGTKDMQTFKSIYKPWQSQCLVGTEGAPNIKLEYDGSLKEYPLEGPPIDLKVLPDENQCTPWGCSG